MRTVFEIVAPHRMTNQAILGFVFEHQRWMLKVWRRQQKTSVSGETMVWPMHVLAQEPIPYRGAYLTLDLQYGEEDRVVQQEQQLQVYLPWKKVVCEKIEQDVRSRVLLWYQQSTCRIIEETIQKICPRIGKWPQSFHLKQQKTRWGSCGIRSQIYINWLLIFAPPGVLEYVVVHELCHLVHRNHGKRFWGLVAKCMPEYPQYETWLKVQGASVGDLLKNKRFLFQ
jgi:predicted metal-dependent hydrolase